MDRLTGHDEHDNIADEDKYHLARRYHNLLLARIESFKSTLPANKCVGVEVGGFTNHAPFHLKEVHYADPTLIALCGKTVDGYPVEIIQDVAHINLKLLPIDPHA